MRIIYEELRDIRTELRNIHTDLRNIHADLRNIHADLRNIHMDLHAHKANFCMLCVAARRPEGAYHGFFRGFGGAVAPVPHVPQLGNLPICKARS